jgi:hypothetical protein
MRPEPFDYVQQLENEELIHVTCGFRSVTQRTPTWKSDFVRPNGMAYYCVVCKIEIHPAQVKEMTRR